MTAALPNPWISNSVDSSPADALTVAVDDAPKPKAATVNFLSQAKATEGKAGMAGVTGAVRRSTAGTGLRVGADDAVRPATSEIMDATAGETAPNSSVSGLDPTRAAIVFGCMTSWLRTEVRDINNQIQLRALASNSDVSFSRA